MNATTRARHERDLIELTGLPTATAKEDRVIAWVERWAKRRKNVELSRDRYGNLMLIRTGVESKSPIIFTAHLDHPAFVVTGVDGKTVTAEFRGGVQDAFFVGTKVRLYRGESSVKPSPPGTIRELRPAKKGGFKTVDVQFRQRIEAQPGDILTWDVGSAQIKSGRLHAPACDDLAGAAAMFAAFGELLKIRKDPPDVRLLCTRAEEIGFVGAIAACKSGIIPKKARLIALENSKSFADSPLGGGPIVRVGDRTSTFDPGLTFAVGQVAQSIAAEDEGLKWQRKLMTGGTCEASAYQALGYTATCVCLPLGNYHNMDEQAGKIDREVIHLDDYHGLVRLLMGIGRSLDDPETAKPLTSRLNQLFADHRSLLS
ncbi:M20/M25/M40 family metallo-hydrolase [Algisphaera agarilytica]|uniref:Endoglucanase n=1 Tax=Algisphaera agarilytica TaxID=1385975 RepID=A0A7X0LKE7_9BACT|nr:M20/M25/M40 family metallo-hydrolase [Algisphaera agarilytica]MBB6430350.1 endoglucanase [Algisphaera agarilytica]